MANKVTFGLKSVHLAFWSALTSTWEAPVAVPGAVNLSLSPEGDESEFYADDVKYYTASSNNGYKGDLEMALIPQATLARILGWSVDTSDMLVEVSDAEPESFALMFEVDGNEAKKRYVFYNCRGSRPNEDAKTRSKSTEPGTVKLPLVITPVDIDGKLLVKASIERTTANATAFDAFFTAVKEPTFGA